MNCPNDRYVNDGKICQAVAANLARIGVKINLQTEIQGHLLPEDPQPQHQLLHAGLDAGTYDAHNALINLMATPTDRARASSTSAATATPKVDELTLQDPGRDRPGQAQRDDQGGLRDPRRRGRPHPAAPAGAGLGDEEERRARAAAGQQHALRWITIKRPDHARGPSTLASTATSGTASFAGRRRR